MGNEPDAAFEYHRLTNYSPPNQFGVRDDPRMVRGYQPMQPALRPPQFKRYPDVAERLPVPDDLDTVLFLSAGVVRGSQLSGGEPLWFRAAGSAGNLSPLELYLLRDGRLCHYEPLEHVLTPLGPAPDGPPAIVLTGVPWRTCWKYTERGYRHLYWDCGTLLSQLLALAPHARVQLGFVDADVRALLGVDGVEEFPLAVVRLTADEPVLRNPTSIARPRGVTAHRAREFPLVTAMQRASELADADDVRAWRRAEPTSPAPVDLTFGEPLESVLRRRGSTRTFDPEAVGPAALLRDALRAASSPVNTDATAEGETLLEHHVLVHAIEGVTPREESRDLGQRLCLNQALGGTGCYTAFHCADLDRVLGDLGARGLRAALLESGIVEGRLHLAAFALGYGATGLTFFDDDVRHAFATETWPMLCTAVGRPTSRPAPTGTPGRPAMLGA